MALRRIKEKIFLRCRYTGLVGCLLGTGLPAHAQAPATLAARPDAAGKTTFQVTNYALVTCSDAARTVVEGWEVRVLRPQTVTAELWALRDGHLSVLQTASATFPAVSRETQPHGRIYLLRAHPTAVAGSQTLALPLPVLGLQFWNDDGTVVTEGAKAGSAGSHRPPARTSLALPGPLSATMFVRQTPPDARTGIAPNHPFVLWAGVAHKQARGDEGDKVRETRLAQAVADANRAAAGDDRLPLRTLCGVLNQQNTKGDLLLFLVVTYQAALPAP